MARLSRVDLFKDVAWPDVVSSVLGILALVGSIYAFWWNRPYARVQRQINVFKDLPVGSERDDWEVLVNREAAALRARAQKTSVWSAVWPYVIATVVLVGSLILLGVLSYSVGILEPIQGAAVTSLAGALVAALFGLISNFRRQRDFEALDQARPPTHE